MPAPFSAAIASIRDAQSRPELVITEIPAPGTLAPHAFALDRRCDARRGTAPTPTSAPAGSCVLYDATEPDAWGGPFRVICYAQAPLETDIGMDPLLADVAWAWLVDALGQRGADYTAASGTATKVLSTGFGELAGAGRRSTDRAAGVLDADRHRPRRTCGRLG